jgi:hypothetical protein
MPTPCALPVEGKFSLTHGQTKKRPQKHNPIGPRLQILEEGKK